MGDRAEPCRSVSGVSANNTGWGLPFQGCSCVDRKVRPALSGDPNLTCREAGASARARARGGGGGLMGNQNPGLLTSPGTYSHFLTPRQLSSLEIGFPMKLAHRQDTDPACHPRYS